MKRKFNDIEFNIDDYPSLKGGWREFISSEFEKPYFPKIAKSIRDDINRFDEDDDVHIFPPIELIFNAFQHTPIENLKVVIIGMDPYIRTGQAMGLSFSVPEGQRIPPSLLNIYKELERDPQIDFKRPKSGDLTKWADEGVFLLNAALTVREGKSDSHSRFGWETFTSATLSKISNECENVVFMVWGKNAEALLKNRDGKWIIDDSKHLILVAGHPSPMNRSNPFVGCGHFSKANEWLESKGKHTINWKLTK